VFRLGRLRTFELTPTERNANAAPSQNQR